MKKIREKMQKAEELRITLEPSITGKSFLVCKGDKVLKHFFNFEFEEFEIFLKDYWKEIREMNKKVKKEVKK